MHTQPTGSIPMCGRANNPHHREPIGVFVVFHFFTFFPLGVFCCLVRGIQQLGWLQHIHLPLPSLFHCREDVISYLLHDVGFLWRDPFASDGIKVATCRDQDGLLGYS